LIDLKECIDKGLLRKTAPSREQARMCLEKAEQSLGDAKANLSEGRYDATVLLAYGALLSASRAMLFNDGMREKSHACVARYLEAKYGDKLGMKTIELLDAFRESRHEVQYSAAFRASKMQAREITEFAEEFLEKAGKIAKG
jgi:uncharacterized protein (UPF0332 family)